MLFWRVVGFLVLCVMFQTCGKKFWVDKLCGDKGFGHDAKTILGYAKTEVSVAR